MTSRAVASCTLGCRARSRNWDIAGLIKCGHCGCSLVGELKKGRYVDYHCTGYRGKCGERYTREEVLEQQFAACLRELVVPPPVLVWLQSEVAESDHTERAARAQTVRREQRDLERTRTRLEILYEDRLDGRIDAATYDKKAEENRQQQERIRQKIRTADAALLPPVHQAVDLMSITSKAADLFLEQLGTEQRKLLRLLLEQASWKGGELRMSFREPFEKLRTI